MQGKNFKGRNLKPARIHVKTNKQSYIPNVSFKANEVCEN